MSEYDKGKNAENYQKERMSVKDALFER